MSTLLAAVTAIWDWFAWAFRALWGAFVDLVQTVWGKWLLVVGWILTVINYAKDIFDTLTGMLGEWLFNTFNLAIPSGVNAALSLANYIFPLDTLVILTVAYLNVILTMMLYRHIKSYVPDVVSGGT